MGINFNYTTQFPNTRQCSLIIRLSFSIIMDGKKGKRLACRLLGGGKGLAEWSDSARVRSGLPTWLEMPRALPPPPTPPLGDAVGPEPQRHTQSHR